MKEYKVVFRNIENGNFRTEVVLATDIEDTNRQAKEMKAVNETYYFYEA